MERLSKLPKGTMLLSGGTQKAHNLRQAMKFDRYWLKGRNSYSKYTFITKIRTHRGKYN